MKCLKNALIVLSCISIIAFAGCNSKTYNVFTNVPEGGFELTDKNFKLSGIIEGYNPPETLPPEEDTSAYTSMGYRHTAMSTDYELVVSYNFDSDGEKARFSQFCANVRDEMRKLDNAISTAVTNSDINKFNGAAAGEEIEISQISYEILTLAKNLYEKTEGYYNPALYYNIYAYGFGTAQIYPEKLSDLPRNEDVAKYTELSESFSELTVYEGEEGGYYVKKPAKTVEVGGEILSMKIDLGGIGKGYAVDKVDGLFDAYGYEYGYFNFGSSSMMFKSHYQLGNYTIAFKNPRSIANDYYFTTPASNAKLSTSGDNNQFYIIDGTRYCHIIDPKTGKPVQTGIMSVSVIGGSAAEDDAYTTAIMAMGVEKAKEFIKDNLCDRKVVFTFE